MQIQIAKGRLTQMFKKKLLLVFFAILSFSACTSTANSNSEVTSSPPDTINITPTEATTVSVGTTVEHIDPNFPEDIAIHAYVKYIYNNPYDDWPDDFNAYLYDLDNDGMPEMIQNFTGLNNSSEYIVYKFINGNVSEMGRFLLGGILNKWCVMPGLTQYYDEQNDEYFCVSESNDGDKPDYEALIQKFSIKENKYILTSLASCKYESYGNSNEYITIVSNTFLGQENTPIGKQKKYEMTHYYDGVEEYLSQFTKVKEIEMKNMCIGDYDSIYDNLYYNYYIQGKK